MTQQNATQPPPRSVYFSALRLTLIFGTGEALRASLRTRFGVHVERSAVLGWVQRDSIPGPIVAQMMVADPSFPVRDLIAERATPSAPPERAPVYVRDHAHPDAGRRALDDLLSS